MADEVYKQYGLSKSEWDALTEEERQAYLSVGEEENMATEVSND